MLRLLTSAECHQISFERLRILDLYLLYPSLLHRASMPQVMKEHFKALSIPHPDDLFMQLPSVAAISQDLRIYQNAAASLLIAKGIVEKNAFQAGMAVLILDNVPQTLLERVTDEARSEAPVVAFLTGEFSTLPLVGEGNVYRRIGLPTRAISQ
jgi:hypothetical protein